MMGCIGLTCLLAAAEEVVWGCNGGELPLRESLRVQAGRVSEGRGINSVPGPRCSLAGGGREVACTHRVVKPERYEPLYALAAVAIDCLDLLFTVVE